MLTLVLLVFYACYGVRANWGRKNALLRDLPYFGILCVGLGSIIFHASLKYYTQWCDDLSMLIAVALVMHRVYTATTTIRITIISGAILAVLLVAFGIFHCMTDDVAFHNLFFAAMIVAVGIRTRQLIHTRIKSPVLLRQLQRLTMFGSIIFVTGYGIWILDHAICSSLTRWRRSIGMPWSFVLELHGYWHIFTGVGAYVFIAEVEYLTGEEAGSSLKGRFAWPIPLVIGQGHELTILGECERDPLLPKTQEGPSPLVLEREATNNAEASRSGDELK